jgi:predicted nucleotidyltransferase
VPCLARGEATAQELPHRRARAPAQVRRGEQSGARGGPLRGGGVFRSTVLEPELAVLHVDPNGISLRDHGSPESTAHAGTVGSVTTLADASLSADELRVVERFVGLLREEFGADLRAVWLYGSRARGERPHDESDVDLLVVLARDSWQDHWRASRLASEAAEAEGESPVWFAVQVYTPERLAQRREIRSFFIQEVDRDKVVLFGEP